MRFHESLCQIATWIISGVTVVLVPCSCQKQKHENAETSLRLEIRWIINIYENLIATFFLQPFTDLCTFRRTCNFTQHFHKKPEMTKKSFSIFCQSLDLISSFQSTKQTVPLPMQHQVQQSHDYLCTASNVNQSVREEFLGWRPIFLFRPTNSITEWRKHSSALWSRRKTSKAEKMLIKIFRNFTFTTFIMRDVYELEACGQHNSSF